MLEFLYSLCLSVGWGTGGWEMGGGTCESEDFLSLIFRLEHYRAYEKSDFTENLDERDGQWKFLILHKIYSELSLSRTGSGLAPAVRIREVSAL